MSTTNNINNTTMTTNLHEAKISTGISKLGVYIPSINLPPVVTCRPNAPCSKCTKEGGGCYAMRGNWLYGHTQKRIWGNLYAYREDPQNFFNSIIAQTKMYRYVRWFSSGDIVDMDFLRGMCKVARTNKNTYYLCFTKKYELVNEYLDNGYYFPKNLKIVLSTWGEFIPENPYNLPMTYTRFKKGNMNFKANKFIPEKAIPCSGKCEQCQMCWALKKGQSVVFNKH